MRSKPTRGRRNEASEIDELKRRVLEEAPPVGANPLDEGKWEPAPSARAAEPGADGGGAAGGPRRFDELPLSQRSLAGLREGGFTRMTDIQRAAIPHALAGRDVLGAARTGSGKTLAFVVPLLERLFRERWTALDGVGALVVSPTRELAMQIFDVLRVAGARHELSAGLVIGGKDFREEAARITRMNVLVATPGRLLQHMDQTVGFELTALLLLILDEADRILDMGFERTVNAIVRGLPAGRQTLLFSATQTKSVRALARLSLSRPQYVATGGAEEGLGVPARLEHFYMELELPRKLDVLWSFLKAHLRAKVLVFVSSCKQARFVHEAFSALRPGVQLLALHGRQKQMKRLAVYNTYAKAKKAVLFATDIAARGLDFAGVDWVVQLDCPEDAATYIHRTGRTARYRSGGKALLMLLPSERAMLSRLAPHKIAPRRLDPNPRKLHAVSARLQALLSERPELKALAQKALVSYVRSVMLQADGEVFDVHALPVEPFAASLGLVGVPRVRFLRSSKPGTAWGRAAKAADARAAGAAGAAGAAPAPRARADGGGEGSEEEEEEEGAAGQEGGDGSEDEETDEEETDEERDGEGDAADGADDADDAEGPAARPHRSRNKLLRLLDERRARQPRAERREPSGDDGEDDLFVVKRVIRPDDEDGAGADGARAAAAAGVDAALLGGGAGADRATKLLKGLSKGKLKLKHAGALAQKTTFDEAGNAVRARDADDGADDERTRTGFVEAVRSRLRTADPSDKAAERERVREKHRAERLKAKARERRPEDDATNAPTLAPSAGVDDGDEDDDEDDETDDDDGREAAASSSPASSASSSSEGEGEEEPPRRGLKRGAPQARQGAAAAGKVRRTSAEPEPQLDELEARALALLSG